MFADRDPDNLGNFLESQLNTEERKSSGTFYTPPQIVRFMCRESLAQYLGNRVGLPLEDLQTFFRSLDDPIPQKVPEKVRRCYAQIDRALETVTVFEPSAGSGAFVLGMLQEITAARMRIEPRPLYRLKAHTTKSSLFMADQNREALEITRRRLWLSLAACCKDGENHSSLPAYPEWNCNIRCGDSLLDHFSWDGSEAGARLKNGGGFDIVIGNPPYISAVEGCRNGKNIREAVKRKYPLLKGAFDLYAAFLLEGAAWTNADGIYCWIVPNKLLVARYAEPVLKFLKQNGLVSSISISDIGAFPYIGVYPIVVTGNKAVCKPAGQNAAQPAGAVPAEAGAAGNPENCKTEQLTWNTAYREYIADKAEDLEHGTFRPKTGLRSWNTFTDLSIRIASGATGFQAELLSGCISGQETDGSMPFVTSGSVDKYSLKYDNIRFMGTTFRRAYISRGEGISVSKWSLWQKEKIVIAGLTREIEAVYCSEPVALGVGSYAIHDFAGFDPYFLLGILNSKFLSWYLNEKYHEKHLAGGYLAINKFTLEQLPLVRCNRKNQLEVAELAARIQHARRKETAADKGDDAVKQMMQEIDGMTRRLFGLNKAEMDAVERFYANRLHTAGKRTV